jgi:DNA modification methylase
MDVNFGAEAPASASEVALPDEIDPYRSFLEAKIKTAAPSGLPCSLDDVPTHLVDGRPIKDHQRHLVRWAVEGGQRALFEAFGLGKSIQQLLICDIILDKVEADPARDRSVPNMGLIVAPLGVRREFMADAAKLGLHLHFVQSDADIDATNDEAGLFLTNYESVRDGKVTPGRFTVVSLDEASILRSFGSKTFQTFLPLFAEVPYRFVATATPSPNRYKELIHYAGFLGVMDTGQALTRSFQRNSTSAGDLTLYPHKEEEFWLWLNSWAAFLQRPSDLGFSDEGYDLPPLTVRYHMVQTEIGATEAEKNGQGRLLRDAALGITQAAAEKRSSLSARVSKAHEIVAGAPADHFIQWHDLEDERRSIEAMLPEAESVYGTQDLDQREGIIERFAEGMTRLLAAKPVMLGSGTNLQRHCHRAVFVGIGFKFNDLIQAIHRLQRFQQEHPVEIDIIYAETETEVLRDLQAKWARHEELTARMSEIIRRYGLNHAAAADTLKRTIGLPRVELSGEGWTAVNNDCVLECKQMASDSVDLIVTSIPFGNHYEYSASYNDFGHTDDHEHFFGQMDHLTPELLRILKPGRIACVHVKDRIQFAAVTGMTRPTVEPFHADTIAHFRRHGFGYMGLHFISTDVVRENNQTYRLTYKELRKDSTKMGCGSPEFLLLFFKLPTDRSNGYADVPVGKDAAAYSLARWQIDAEALWRSSGDRPLTPAELSAMQPGSLPKTFRAWSVQDVYDHEGHVAIAEALEARDALPKTFASVAVGSCREDVWTDIARMQTLNGEQTRRGLENHICPLQFDIVDRAIRLYSAPGELVLDPFGGLMTVPMRALMMGRRGYGVELNPDYFADGIRYMRETEAQRAVPSLFDLIGEAA